MSQLEIGGRGRTYTLEISKCNQGTPSLWEPRALNTSQHTHRHPGAVGDGQSL